MEKESRKGTKLFEASRWTSFFVILALLTGSVIIMIVLNTSNKAGTVSSDDKKSEETLARNRNLSEVDGAKFLSILVYDGNGGVSSFMAGGKTSQFDVLAKAVKEAKMVSGTSDASFSDMLIFSFGSADTVEISYSPGLNLIAFNGQIYKPALDIGPVVREIEQKVGS